MKFKILSFLIICVLLISSVSIISYAEKISAPSYVLMEEETGTILKEKDSHTKRPIASVTKIMTLQLIFDALKNKQIQLSDSVTVSKYAASMGGSQVFLEENEVMDVATLIKCISIASANDACVAMAEFLCGSEEHFVAKMNAKAKALKMNDTLYKNCCGLDAPDHYSSAYDIAILTRHFVTTHPDIYSYCQIWQEDITHLHKNEKTVFTLTNTNKLLKQSPYITGLKTGSTSKAKFCLSATASKDNLNLIAVVLGCESSKIRNQDVLSLLQYGFANTSIYKDSSGCSSKIKVKKSNQQTICPKMKYEFCYLNTSGQNSLNIKKKINLPHSITAPINKGQTIGSISYYYNKKEIGTVPLVAPIGIKKATYSDYLTKVSQYFLYSSFKSQGKYKNPHPLFF